METSTELAREILFDFLDRWTVENITNMSLSQYVSVGDKDTFCQWLETKTKRLGSIKGINSSKFGIYKRSDKTKKIKNLINDNEYSWQRYYSDSNRADAFKNVKKEILQIIEFAQNGQFEKIDSLHLTVFFKWKIAYLYSNERLIPIFKKEVLIKIANHFGLKTNRQTKVSEIQKIMIANKPAHLSIYEYSDQLFEKFGRIELAKTKERKRRTTRKAATGRNTNTQTRSGSTGYIATLKHNLLQEALEAKLIKLHGEKCVYLEENFVDITVKLADKILLYEVKSAAYASDCVREALGQMVAYSHSNQDKRKKTLIVAGQYQPNENETEFINYVKSNLKLDFEYESIDL